MQTIDNPYNPTRGQSQLLGHQEVARRIVNYLTQPTPPHISIIGPKYSGKSTLVSALAEQLRGLGEPFLAVVLWDLRRDTPQTDEEFKTQLGEKLWEQLRSQENDTARELADHLAESPDDLETAFDFVREAGQRLVIFFDNHERAIEQSNVTENLWSTMENLSNNPNISFVATSPLPLAESSFKREVQNSLYWRKYDPTINLESFGADDWPNFFEPFTENNLAIDESAKKEVANWSGGVPVLAAELTKRLFNRATEQKVSKADVDALAEEMLNDPNYRGLLKNVWRSLDAFSQLHFTDASNDCAKISEWSNDRREDLQRRGLVAPQGATVKGSCRLLHRWAISYSVAPSILRQAFGKTEDYETNFGVLLQLRLDQITPLDSELRRCVERVLRVLDNPNMAVGGLRAIFDRAMICLWDAETGGSRQAPASWNEGGRLPQSTAERGKECSILDAITGKHGMERVAKHATKPTFILAQCIKSCGDFGEHSGDTPITAVFANAACLAAVELCESLSKDLAN